MSDRRSRMQPIMPVTVTSLFMLTLFVACASDSPKSPPSSTPDQVRGHADRAFDNLKKEERERGGDPAMPR